MSELSIREPATEADATRRIEGALIGVLIGFQQDGCTPLVIFPGQAGDAGVPARVASEIRGSHIGREVVLVFEGADPGRPIIVGCVARSETCPTAVPGGAFEVEADGERMVVNAQRELVLRCGSASITLTSAGKVLIHGTYVSSRSSGVMRIKGATVHLN